jgi:enamine deaminase RidA (YjgF/YER057c/UK114 family)
VKMKTIRSPNVKDPAPRTWSNARVCGGQFFVSGMTAHDGAGSIEGDASMYGQAALLVEINAVGFIGASS